MTLTNLGGVLLSTGELAPARQALDKAIALQQEIGHKRGLGFSLFFLAEWQRAHDLLEGAQTTIEQDIALRKELGDDVHLPESQIQLAEIALEQENSGEAESLARTAAAAFDQQKITDLGAQSYAVISRALLDQGKFREAQIAADHAMVLSRLGGDLKASFDAVFAVAAVKAAAGNVTEATKMLEGVRAEVSRRGYTGYELKARLRLGELEIRSGNTSSGRAHLEQLQSEAKQKGFLLIARKAATARN
jgi:tetratricopeptide (TPR) repeat protein